MTYKLHVHQLMKFACPRQMARCALRTRRALNEPFGDNCVGLSGMKLINLVDFGVKNILSYRIIEFFKFPKVAETKLLLCFCNFWKLKLIQQF